MSTQPLIPERAGKAIIGQLESVALGGVQGGRREERDGRPHMGRQ